VVDPTFRVRVVPPLEDVAVILYPVIPEPVEAGAFHVIIADVSFMLLFTSVGGPGADIILFLYDGLKLKSVISGLIYQNGNTRV
jgi:hypothetical protein